MNVKTALRKLNILLVIAVSTLWMSTPPTSGADTPPPTPPRCPDDLWFTKPGPSGQPAEMLSTCPELGPVISRPESRPELAKSVSTLATGGPDDFGYTWNDSVPISWVDATSGTDTGMSGYASIVGPISLPFEFRYYENTYSSLYIGSGYLTFTDPYDIRSQGEIPDPSPPNNVIAPFWTPIFLNSIGPTGRVYYQTFGTAPNRYFVVEWYDVKGGDPSDTIGGDDTYRFEVILYETTNDIVFQYQTMTYNDGAWCGSAGIEDSTGLDGLSYLPLCYSASSNSAVRFYRPAPAARVGVSPLNQGIHTHAGENVSFSVSITNKGDLGSDSFDLAVSSIWPVSLYAADGITPLTDSNGNGSVDTGLLDQGASTDITLKVLTPVSATLGNANSAVITVSSFLDTSRSKAVNLQTAVPSQFAQVYIDFGDGAMSLYLAHPAGQGLAKATPNYYYGFDPAVAKTPSGNLIYAWEAGRCLDDECNVYVYEIEYTLRNNYGDSVVPVKKLTNNSGATVVTVDETTAIAVAPNGRMGLTWVRFLYNRSNSQYNFNLYFAVLDASGNPAYGPVKLTNNTVWGTWGSLNVPWFGNAQIAATDDNRFVLSWFREVQQTGGYVDDIYYAVRDTNGNQVRAITQFTYDAADYYEGYFDPNLTSLTGNRALLTWSRDSDGDIYFAVLDSAGNVYKSADNLVEDGAGQYDHHPEAVQLSDGKTVIAWTTDWGNSAIVRFAVLESAPAYGTIVDPIALSNPASTMGNNYVSLAADSAGRAILTWTSNGNNRSLYYGLVDGGGSVLTQPMIFRSGPTSFSGLWTNWYGNGNTSLSITPSANVDALASFGGRQRFPISRGETETTINLRYTNLGLSPGTGAVLTLTFANELTYLGDDSGMGATVNGNTVTWHPQDINFLGGQQFDLEVAIPDSTPGTSYPLTLLVTSNGPEDNPTNNSTSAQVLVPFETFLPLIRR